LLKIRIKAANTKIIGMLKQDKRKRICDLIRVISLGEIWDETTGHTVIYNSIVVKRPKMIIRTINLAVNSNCSFFFIM
jgi:hypothetical protein